MNNNLVVGVCEEDFELQAQLSDKLNGFVSPLSQWVASGFDSKCTFTLTNREAVDGEEEAVSLKLPLQETKVAGEG